MTIANEALFSGYVDSSLRSREKGQSQASAKSTVRLQTLKVPRASELVAENLRSLIVTGKVAPGVGLPSEKELVSQLGVSRATLREALRMLEAEGLIATRPGPKGGIVVQRPGSDQLTRSLSLLLQLEDTPFTAILEARRLLEPLCANLAAERATPEDLAELKASVEGIRQSIGDTSRYVEEQLRFHLAIFAAAHNSVLRLYTISVGDLITLRTAQIGLSEKAQRIGLKAAEWILAAIVAGDGALAAHRVTAHLRAFEMLLIRQTRGADFPW